ncbi:hypothetical protein [Phaeodactylibacter sp.]|jgi:hypothetical protein|uniref:hypothetical protein n=1 Tax=Phaeodactylibacter sp. TaxID=1940289 RepID=UPI0025F7798A|nr:hypothetical protein [Phaeodactylibacter sp.]MCI4648769.1 hypothetical protein [Phaeodactylibacter sp.]MCI5094101.1 hypothetical protein [Phaeodactylibacter sp.]
MPALQRLLIGLLLALPIWASAQADSAQLKAAFRFQDGVYLSIEALRNNQPDYRWKDLSAKLAANAESYRAQAEYIRSKDGVELPRARIWGMVLDGLPYILLPNEAVKDTSVLHFAGLRVRGRICYYEFEREVERLVEIKAYNPLTGRPFRRGNISKREIINEARILHLLTEQHGPLDQPTLISMIGDDTKMYRTVDELPATASTDMLYKCVLIYDDRNPIYIPVPKKEATKSKK